jgi:hypothetical protein
MDSVTEMLDIFLTAKFTLIREKNHPIFRCPCGHRQVSTSNSHCGGRGSTNARLLVRRVLRQCAELEAQGWKPKQRQKQQRRAA